MSVVQRSSEVASREALLIQNKTSRRLEKFQMPSKNRNNNKTNGQVLFIFRRSEQGRASTRDSFTWQDKFFVVPRLF